ncbi:hypothetical protein RA2_00838 [Roseovarius sp. A-2]|uniref:hypothetical protein n=1 Tax=Roseovarius sp. A-2 TaxID=1570360 RepID=UPI0009D4AB2E|nr:hypothetical protein [Roseovarius sp. A-2]GAW33794.1 hypothetical protein RA2_00838 [Roseovarius sp. A-2]
MILKGSQRDNVAKHATHLLNMRENGHVDLHDLRTLQAIAMRAGAGVQTACKAGRLV